MTHPLGSSKEQERRANAVCADAELANGGTKEVMMAAMTNKNTRKQEYIVVFISVAVDNLLASYNISASVRHVSKPC